MYPYINTSELNIGDKVKVLNPAGAGWLEIGKIYTIKSLHPGRNEFLISFEENVPEIKGAYRWCADNNEKYHYFKIVDQSICTNLLKVLDKLIAYLSKNNL